jgi:hypothetical protein
LRHTVGKQPRQRHLEPCTVTVALRRRDHPRKHPRGVCGGRHSKSWQHPGVSHCSAVRARHPSYVCGKLAEGLGSHLKLESQSGVHAPQVPPLHHPRALCCVLFADTMTVHAPVTTQMLPCRAAVGGGIELRPDRVMNPVGWACTGYDGRLCTGCQPCPPGTSLGWPVGKPAVP